MTDMVNLSKLPERSLCCQNMVQKCRSDCIQPTRAHMSNSQWLCLQLKQLSWATATREHTPYILQVFCAELKPAFSFFVPSVFLPHGQLFPREAGTFIATICFVIAHILHVNTTRKSIHLLKPKFEQTDLPAIH